MPIITFSLPQDIHDKVKQRSVEGESENLAAKRILLSALGIESPVFPSDEMANIVERIERLEQSSEEQRSRLATVENQLDKLESTPVLIAQPQPRKRAAKTSDPKIQA